MNVLSSGSLRYLACTAILLLLGGCTAQRLLSGAEADMREANYEKALAKYDEGVKRFPDDLALRAASTRARSEAASRLVGTALSLKAANRFDDAGLLLKRALAIEPSDERARSVLAELEADQRAAAAIVTVNDLLAKGLRNQALDRLAEALRENPRNADLIGLQRRLASEQRRDAEQTVRLVETRPISLQFRDANLKMVLEAMSRGTELNFVLDRDIRPDQRVTIFLRNVLLEEAIDVLVGTNQLARKVLDSTTVLIYPNTPEKQKEYQELVVRAFYLANADAKQTAALLRTMLKLRELFVDDKLNLIVMRETAETIRLAERLVALHDISDPEVLLEVEVLEVQRSKLLDLGIQFPDTFSLTPLSSTGSSTNLTLNDLKNLNSSRIAVGIAPVAINLRREVADSSVLANPRIRARNREKARVMIGDKIPVVTSTSTATGFVSENVQYLDVGLKLEVEPQVFLGDDIAMKISLEVSSVAKEVRTSSGSLAYQIGTRNATTTLRLRDGETQLLAGLISAEDRSTANRIPGLGDLPVLGRLFSSQLDTNSRSEIVLSITPRLVRSAVRPELSEIEFSSGTEAGMRLRPPPASKPAAKAAAVAAGSGPQAAVAPQPANPALDLSAAVGLPAQEKPAPPRLTLIGPRSVERGAKFVVSIMLSSALPLRGVPLMLSFDRDRLEVESVEAAGFFRQGGSEVSFNQGVSPNGTLQIGILRVGADGAKGSDVAATLTLKAIGTGPARIAVDDVKLIPVTEAAPAIEAPAPLTIDIK